MTISAPVTPAPGEQAWPSTGAAAYLIIVLTIASMNSYIDRIILSLMITPIKETFGIDDTQVGLLQGVAFGLFYTLAALPLGRLVDYADRRAIIAIGTTFFSICTVASGLAQTYWQLFLARVGVGAGEASLNPAAYSMLADTFPKERLSGALGVFTMGAFIGIGGAFVLGGAVVQWALTTGPIALPIVGTVLPWQMAFFIVGLPGFLIALWVATLKEPLRRGVVTGTDGKLRPPPVSLVTGRLWRERALYIPMFAGFCMITLNGYAGTSWTPEFFKRTFDWTAGEVGLWYGLIGVMFASVLGAFAGGQFSDWVGKRHADAPLRVAALAMMASWIPSGIATLMPDPWLALGVLAVAQFFTTFTFPLAAAAIQLSTPNQLRGQTSALYLFTINLCGLGLGPVVVGLMNDTVFPGGDGVRYSLALVNAVTAPLAAVFLWMALRPYREAKQRYEMGG
jgi:MFS family permease